MVDTAIDLNGTSILDSADDFGRLRENVKYYHCEVRILTNFKLK